MTADNQAFLSWYRKRVGDPDAKNPKGLESRDLYVAREAWKAALLFASQEAGSYSSSDWAAGWGEMGNMAAADTAACEIADRLEALAKAI